jgi:hypothetical protein
VYLRANYVYQDKRAAFFETTIRHVGGLLSAYALSGRQVLLDKADLLARKLSPVFDTESGLPQYDVNPSTCVIPMQSHFIILTYKTTVGLSALVPWCV